MSIELNSENSFNLFIYTTDPTKKEIKLNKITRKRRVGGWGNSRDCTHGHHQQHGTPSGLAPFDLYIISFGIEIYDLSKSVAVRR